MLLLHPDILKEIEELATYCFQTACSPKEAERALIAYTLSIVERVGVGQRHLATEPPPRYQDWNHSERVLVYYPATERHTDTYSVAYYHYKPPFEDPGWVDFTVRERTPQYWWYLPSLPVDTPIEE